MHVQAALHETTDMLKEVNQDISRDHGYKFNSMAATVSQTQTQMEDIACGLVRVNVQLESNTATVPNLPEGYGRPARWRIQAPQFFQWSNGRGCGDECEGGEHGGNGGNGGFTNMGNIGNMNGPDCHCEHLVKLFVDMSTVRLDIGKLQNSRTPLIPPRLAFNEVVRDILAALQIAATGAAQTHFSGPHKIQSIVM